MTRWARIAGVLVALELAALLLLGTVTVVRFPAWAEIDERAHYAVVQEIAEERRLPVITDLVSPEVQAITDGTWPAPSPRDPAQAGLAGRVYEAFQPPLYYVAAVPAFLLVGDHSEKIDALRAFDLLLVLAGVAVLWLLVRELAPAGAALPVLAAALLVVLWPGFVVRGVTVSNAALEMVLAPAFLLAAWRAYRTGSARALLAAAVLLALCLLTKLTLVLLAPLLLAAAARHAATGRRGVVRAVAALATPALALAPWLAFNLDRYGSLTASEAAREQQIPYLYPAGVPEWGLGAVPGRLAALADGVLPQEWDGQLGVWWVRAAVLAVGVGALAAGAACCAPARGPARTATWFMAVPVAGGLVLMTASLVLGDWDVFLLRYLYPVLPALAVALAACVATRRPRGLTAAVACLGGLIALLWLDMALAFLFTDVGDRLGV